MSTSPASSDHSSRSLSFGRVSDAYDRARPGYPREAVEWMTGRSPVSVVELGAGTGKLTDRLLEVGHDVLATDPSDEMLSHLRMRHEDARTATAYAEQVPVATRSVDVVVAAQSFHWFDVDAALAEAARMLKPEGRIALVWNDRDERIPWVRKLGAILGPTPASEADPTDALLASGLFGYVETESFRHWQQMRRADLHDLALSRSNVSTLEPMAQERLLRKVDELFDVYDRGPDGLLMPYVTRCYRAVVRPRGRIEEPEHSADLTAAAEAIRAKQGPEASVASTTLIDFR